MKITTSGETITVDNWRGNRFHAKVQEITEVRVMADKAIPSDLMGRLRHYFGRAKAEMKLRAIIVWAGDKAITLDSYYDDHFESAADWFSRNGWDIASAVATAIKTPLVRVTVHRVGS